MSIKNINELDNNSNIQNIKNNKDIIHALANMGQRMGVKGDSIIYKSIELINVLNENINSENILKLEGVKNNINDYIGYLYYVNNDDTSVSCKYGVIKKSELMDSKNGYINNSNTLLVSTNNNYSFFNTSKDIFNELYTKDTNIEGINILNNIKQINENSIIKVKNNHLYSLIFGKIINSENYEIIYNDFDLETNSLKYALRAFKESDNYKLYEFDINNDKNPILNIYTLILSNIVNLDNLLYNQNIQKTFSDYFTNTDNVIKNFKNIDISDLNYIKSSNFIFGYFFDSELKSYKLNYNNENNTKLSLNTSENINDNNEELTNIINRINYINNDINILIPSLIKYYHYNFYSSNINNVILRILQSIYENMCFKHYISYSNKNINDKEINFNDNRFVLYFPLDYKLFYECNKNNIFDIYQVNNLYINRLNLENYDVNLISYDELLSNILFSSNLIKQSMFDVYNVTFNYNEHYDNNYISSIESVYLYTLPYIDKSNYNWYINGQNSGMTSYLHNSLFQNIIIINSINVEENNIEGKYLTNIPDDILHYFNNGFEVKTFDISYERIKSNTIDSERNQLNNDNVFIKDTITFSTLLPKTTEYDYANIYKNTLIISLSKFNENNLNNCLMCTVWKYTVDINGNNDWEIIRDSSTNDVLDLSSFLNLGLLKNRSLNTKDYIFKYFGMLMNDLGKDYHNPYGDDIITLTLLQKDKNNDLGLNLSVISSDDISIVDNKLLTKNNKDIKNISEITQTTDKYLNTENINIVDKNIKIIKENTETNSESEINDNTATISGENITYDNNTEIDYTNLKDYTIKDTPLLNISEVLLDHSQVLNRLNVISLNEENKEKKIYNTIIGVELDKDKKNIFAIRPSSINIDIGTNTLIDQKKIDEFNKLDKIVIDFDNIELNGNNIELNGNVKSGLIKQQLSDNSYICYKDFVLFTNTKNPDNTNNDPIIIKEETNNKSMIINIKKLLEINNINFFDVDNVTLITFNNDITIDKNNDKILLIIDNSDYIENDDIDNNNFIAKCSKDLRITKYVNDNDTKYIVSLV